LLALIIHVEAGEYARRMPRIVAVLVRHIAEWQRGNTSPIDLARSNLLTLIHHQPGREKERVYSHRSFSRITAHCIRKQSRRHAEKCATRAGAPREQRARRV